MPAYDARDVDAAAGPGATAVLHGMLATLTEVLEGLDRRLAGLEALVEGVQVDALSERVARLEERLDDRFAELAGGRDRTVEALAAIGNGVGHLAARLDQLAEADDEPEPQPEPEDRIGPLAEAVDRLAADVGRMAADVGRIESDVGRVEGAVEAVGRRLDGLPVPEPVDVSPVMARLGELATSVDAVGFGVAGLTDALRSEAADDDEPDVVGPVVEAVARESERICAAVAAVGEAVGAVQAETVHRLGALADRPTEVRVDVDLDRIVAVLEAHGAAVRDEVTRLDTLLRGQVAEVAGRAGAVTEVMGRLDGRLHEVVDGVRALQRRAHEPARLTAVNGE